MNTEIIKVNMNMQELDIPWMRIEFIGKLFAATPSKAKPRGISPETWAISLLDSRSQFGKCRIAIPRSFWSSNSRNLTEKAGMCFGDWIDLMDAFGGTENLDGNTPQESIQTIIDYLKRGDDVVILSPKRKISGFIPAILSKIFDPHVHIVKVWYPIIYGSEYELTPFQYGYIYGQSDASKLKSIYKDTSCDQEYYDKKDDNNKVQYFTGPNNSELKELIAEARTLLETIGQALFANEALEIHDLVKQLGECEKHHVIEECDAVHLGFNAIIYRLCDVMKAVATEGQNALTGAKLNIIEFPTDVLQTYQQQILLIADRLRHIGSIDLCFLCCDLSVLIEHPEIAITKDLVSSLQAIQNQLSDIEERIEDTSQMMHGDIQMIRRHSWLVNNGYPCRNYVEKKSCFKLSN